MDECKAFGLMEHVMFRREIRKQFLPDMEELQIQLYQLTRLLHDRLPNLRALFDRYDVSASLYAAPWMLTIFASQFPLGDQIFEYYSKWRIYLTILITFLNLPGFVTRVFDLIFLDGRNVIFKVSLALLDHHKEQLLQCHNFEEVMNYLKVFNGSHLITPNIQFSDAKVFHYLSRSEHISINSTFRKIWTISFLFSLIDGGLSKLEIKSSYTLLK